MSPVPTQHRSTIALDKHASRHRSFRTQRQPSAAISSSHRDALPPINLRHRQECLCYQNRAALYYNPGT